jgi:Zn-dependent M28 family amino/carboxypeptidase
MVAARAAVRPFLASRLPRDPGVAALVGRVSRDEYETVLSQLVSHPTRHSLSAPFRAAADEVADRLRELGHTVELTTVAVPGGESVNVVAERPGAGPEPRRLVHVVGHLDSVNLNGVDAPAPGADDNASGAAGVLEIGRVLTDQVFTHDLRLILFGGEEQNLHGSTQYVAALAQEDRARTAAVVNMDMIARRNVSPATVLLEGGEVSQPLIDLLAAAAGTYTSLGITTSLTPFASDHVPFIKAGLPAVLTIEGEDQQNLDEHTNRDTLERLDLDLAVEILRMNVAATVMSVGLPAGREDAADQLLE